MRRRLQMRLAADVRMRSVAKEKLTASEIENGANEVEEAGEAIAGAVDAVTGAVLIETDETLIGVVHEDRYHPPLDVETQEIEDYSAAHRRQEISTPTFQAVEVSVEEMDHAVDRLQHPCHQGIRGPDRAHLLDVDAAQIQYPCHHIRDAVARRPTEIVADIAAEVVEVEEEVQIVVLVEDHTRLPIAPDLDLRRLASGDEAHRSP